MSNARASASRFGLPQLLLLGTIWGVTFPIARAGVESGADPILLVALDLALATAAMATVAAVTGTVRPDLRHAAESAALGALLIGGINLPLYWGLRTATGGSAAIVYATAPFVSLVVLAGVRRSPVVGGRQLIALGVGLAGVVLLGVATSGSSVVVGLAGLIAFAVGAACQGTGAVLVGRSRPAGENHWGLSFEFGGGAIAALVLLPWLTPTRHFPVSLASIGSILFVGLASMAVGFTLYFDLIRRAGPVRANQVTFVNPMVAILVGVLAFRERFVPLEAAALGLIVVALALLQRRADPTPAPSGGLPAPSDVGENTVGASPPARAASTRPPG